MWQVNLNIEIDCKICGKKQYMDGLVALEALIFNKPLPIFVCYDCREEMDLNKDEWVIEVRDALSKILDMLMEDFMPILLESGILQKVFGENANIKMTK